MRRRSSPLLVTVALMAALVAPSTPAAAAYSPLLAEVCGGVEVRAGADGVVRGFASGSCSQPGQHDGSIRYLERSAGAWSSQTSPYTGAVLGVADNGSQTFLMYENANGMFVTKRGHDGTFAGPGWHLAGATAGGDVATLADGFLAVWVRPAAAPEGLDMVSWGRYNGYIHPRTVVTGNAVPDLDPVLATAVASPGSDPTVDLVWTRFFPDRSVLRFATGSPDVGWVARTLTGLGTHNEHADLVPGAGGSSWVSWARDGRAMVATDETDRFVAVTLPGTTGDHPQVAVGTSPTLPVVGYAVSGSVLLAARSAEAWKTSALASGAQVADVTLAAVDARGNREATVLYTTAATPAGNAELRAVSVLFAPR